MSKIDENKTIDADAPAVGQGPPQILDGQMLDQPSFHERYSAMPEDFRAELIDGVVYIMNLPLHPDHGRPDSSLNGFLFNYRIETPGTILQSNTTSILDPRNEVQPDSALLIDPECGGQTGGNKREATRGCPELVVEIASSSLRVDLNVKKRAYEQAGALEYLVYDVPHEKFHWFALRDGRFEPLEVDEDGLYRSRAFPGLWLDPTAFARDDQRTVMAALRRGLESPGHADFVERLRLNRANRP